jgi:hypothetical protein
MHANHDERTSGTTSEKAIEKAIRDHLSPEGVVAIIAFLQPAAVYKPANDEARQALLEVEWFAGVLTRILGTDEHNRLIEELGL